MRLSDPELNILKLLIVSLFLVTGCQNEEHNSFVPVATCYDNIQNQGETSIDCGGPCNLCPAKMTATIDGAYWQSAGSISSSTNDSSIIILAGNGTTTLSMIYTGDFILGTFPLNSAIYGITATQTYYLSNSGTITFTRWDSHDNQVSGKFNFIAVASDGSGDTVKVENGNFEYVPY